MFSCDCNVLHTTTTSVFAPVCYTLIPESNRIWCFIRTAVPLPMTSIVVPPSPFRPHVVETPQLLLWPQSILYYFVFTCTVRIRSYFIIFVNVRTDSSNFLSESPSPSPRSRYFPVYIVCIL